MEPGKPYQPKNINDLYNDGHLKASFFPEENEWHPFKLPVENQRQYQKLTDPEV